MHDKVFYPAISPICVYHDGRSHIASVSLKKLSETVNGNGAVVLGCVIRNSNGNWKKSDQIRTRPLLSK